jgi:hypothetical protein
MKRLPGLCPFNKTKGTITFHDAQCGISNAAEISVCTLKGKMT